MKILIVDDEMLIRTSISCYLADHGVPSGEIDQAGNAAEMKALLTRRQYGVVFVDVCMPGLDGLSALDAYSDLQKHAAFYIISGYSKFEYAQKALRLHVEDYLLKPITPEQIANIVVLQQQREQKRIAQKQEALSEAVKCFFEGKAYEPSDLNTVVVTFMGMTERKAYHGMLDEISKALHGYTGETCCRFSYAYLDFFVLESSYPSDELKPLLLPLLGGTGSNALLQCADAESTLPLTDVLLQAARLVIKPSCRCYQAASDAAFDPVMHALACLYHSYGQGQPDSFTEAAKRFCLTLHAQNQPLSEDQQQQLLRLINRFFHVASFTAERIEQVAQLLNLCATKMQPSSGSSDGLQQVKTYLNEHFTDKISVAMLSDQFGYTPNYLSASFTKKNGINLMQYVTQLRLSYAVSLLAKPEVPVQTIADMCGYSDANYFTRLFTRCYQCSPSEYRRKHLQSGTVSSGSAER